MDDLPELVKLKPVMAAPVMGETAMLPVIVKFVLKWIVSRVYSMWGNTWITCFLGKGLRGESV